MKRTRLQSILFMACLIIAGEAIFALPFHITRFFRPTFLDVFGFTNTQLGDAQSIYGVLAMLAYFPGGPLADRFSARKLLAGSLLCTAVGGYYMATFPGQSGLTALWGFWGVTTILLFWAALIRATREWGGEDEQGRAFGILDGGRGLLAAGLASLAVVAFSLAFPEDPKTATPEQKRSALETVIYGYTALTALAAVLVFVFVPDNEVEAPESGNAKAMLASIVEVIKIPSVWLQSLILICAYVGYKGFDNYSLYAVQGYGMSEVSAAGLAAFASWIRPVAAIGAGLLGDRFRSARIIVLLFSMLVICNLVFAVGKPGPIWLLIGNTACTCVGIFGLRGLYFALLEEAKIPTHITGAAVGVISVIGYTPEVFVPRVGGWILDRTPGLEGHQHFFAFMAVFAVIGVVTAAVFDRLNARKAGTPSTPN